ncbi:Ohr family peroxiredoxin [Paenibacillus polymyxa]|uniref:Ohr family peroxiredoxin n=1 Tax=Paenibacillus polymyxa TaxID=1406 RepID=UPI002378837E|nr:Ohr family peroxiredoxin [Paenibacillus polymyxa]WDM23832.1 Ohr family peroxiredoxin [Paenibacillus polymyxa]
MMTIQQKMYETTVKAVGGRNGYIESSFPELRLDIDTPKEMGGAGGAGTNPEQLFAAGYSACFDSALNMVARMQRVKHEGTEVTATVHFGKVEDAHEQCPYSRATRGNIEVKLNVL